MRSLKSTLTAAAAALLLAAGGAGAAPQAAAAGITITEPWVVEVPPVNKVTAAFMKVENGTAADQTLVSVASDAAGATEIHEMKREEGMMRMRRVGRLVVPAHGSVELKPGGYHLMLIDLNRRLAAGDQVTLTLRFESGLEERVTAKVRKRGEE